jgi:diguanylate cyclase (GGDEF)-like protein
MGATIITRSRYNVITLCLLAVLLLAPFQPMWTMARALDLDKSLGQCRLDIWTQRDGLPSRHIESLAQTSDGFIWMATRGGVIRFDGTTFQTFNHQNTSSFFRDMALSVAAGPGGEPWIGTDGGGCGPLREGAFHPISMAAGKTLWSKQNVLYTAKDGSIWLAGEGQFPLIHVDHEHVQVFPEKSAIGASAEGCCGLTEDRTGRLWMLSWAGLQVREPNGQFRVVQKCADPTALVATPDGGLWIGTKHGLLRLYNDHIRKYGVRDGLSSDEIRSLCIDHDGNLWIGTAAGLARLANGKFTTFGVADGLADASVGPIMEDREGSLWVATDSALNRFTHTKLTPIDLCSGKGGTPQAMAPTEAPDGSVWFATTHGLFRVHGYEPAQYGVRQGLPFEDVQAVAAGADSTLFLLNSVGDLYHYASGHTSVVAKGCSLHSLARDSAGLIALTKDGAVCRLDHGRLRKITKLPGAPWIFSLYVDSHDVLWLASTIGLLRIQGGHVEVIHKGLPDDTHVLSVAEGSSGDMWLGTDKGLGRFRNGRCRVYSISEGLPDDNIYVVQEDGEGNVWAGGTRGLFTLRLAHVDAFDSGLIHHLETTLYDGGDGIRNFPVLAQQLRGRDGRLWFTGDKGVTVVDPRHIRKNLVVPNVLIEQASGDDLPLRVRAGESLAPGTKKLEFRYTCLSLAAPERVRFQYRLVGYDKNWVDAGTRRTAYYTNLPAGRYRFEVTACNNDGVWNPIAANYTFTLEPHFYQTGWFIGLCILTVLALIWGAVYIRMGQFRKRNRELERRVTLRTAQFHTSVQELHESKRMLEDANSELQSSREELVAYNQELTAINDEMEAANARLEALATTDGMTAIANHRAFQDQMRVDLARAARDTTCTTLLLCDVDHFKQYNDSYGHPAGDEVLRQVARLLKERVREGDFVARYGGEEFAVILPNTGAEEALEVAERLRAAIYGTTFPLREITISIGASVPMIGAVAPHSLVESADQALYAAKHSGRNCVVLGRSQRAQSIAPSVPESILPARRIEIDEIAELAGSLLGILNLRDAETNGHSQRVARYTAHLARQAEAQGLYVFAPSEMRNIELGALLHDIGKLGIPDAILYKPATLNDAEWEIMRSHPLLGAEVLRSCTHFAGAMPSVRSHHERWDGTGYPDQLHGSQIPVAARIFALADALDAMSTNRPYREALPFDVIVAEVKRMSGHQFDPALVEVFLSVKAEAWEELSRQPSLKVTMELPKIPRALPWAA